MRNVAMLIGFIACAASWFPTAEPLAAVGRIDLPGVEGRFDHFAFDAAGGRLFVAALGNNTIEAVDPAAAKRVTSLRGADEPQGLAFIPPGRLIVANGGTGDVQVREGADLHIARTVKTRGDADNVRYDEAAGRAYAGVAAGALVAIDPVDEKVLAEARLDAHPESFQLERSGPRIFVNVPNAHHVAVVDRRSMAVTAKWPVTAAAANYPMALDEEGQRLFVVCRTPARVLVYDTAAGRMVTSVDTVGDADDVFWDAARKRLYVIGGEGFVDIVQRQGGDRYSRVAKVTTGSGARTGLFVPSIGRLFVAAPHRGAQPAAILIFEARD